MAFVLQTQSEMRTPESIVFEECPSAQSVMDGYTLLLTSGGLVSINPAIYPKMPFAPNKDIIPVAATARVLVLSRG